MALPWSVAPLLHISPRPLCPLSWGLAVIYLCRGWRWGLPLLSCPDDISLPSFYTVEWEDPFIRQPHRFWTGSDQDLWLSSWDTKTSENGRWSQGEHGLNQDIHPNDCWKMISSKRDTHTRDYGMRKEELVLCRKEHQGWGPCLRDNWEGGGQWSSGASSVSKALPSYVDPVIQQRLVHPYNGISVQNKKRNAVYTCNNLDKSQRLYAEWKSQFQNILYHFLYMTLLNRQNYSNGEQFSSC